MRQTVEGWEFEMPERGGDVPDILDEARVELEWILKTQFDDGSFAHKVTALRFEPDVLPTADGQERWFFSTSTHSTGNAVAVLAAAGRIYADYDADFAGRCLESAERGYVFLSENDEIASELNDGGTGAYDSSGDLDERAWAAVELWETTGDDEYLADFEASDMEVRYNFDWPDSYNLAVATYLGSEREGRSESKHRAVQVSLYETAERMVEAS